MIEPWRSVTIQRTAGFAIRGRDKQWTRGFQ
jgi:hypothetical protein